MALYSSMAAKRTMQLRDGRVLSYCLIGHKLEQQQHIDANSTSSSLAKVPIPAISPAARQPIRPTANAAPAATVVYHHGWPSSAAEAGVWHTAASELAVQMVAVDRPGIGGSTFDPKGEHGRVGCHSMALFTRLFPANARLLPTWPITWPALAGSHIRQCDHGLPLQAAS